MESNDMQLHISMKQIWILTSLFFECIWAGTFESSSIVFPNDYDKHEPPFDKGHPADVYIALYIMDIDRIDDGKMEFSIQLYFEEAWQDNRLNLSIFMNDIVEDPTFPTYLIPLLWEPDIVLDNTKDGKLFPLSLPNTVLKVSKEGFLEKESRYNFIVGCRMDFHLYPMDSQECYIKISSLSNPSSKVLFHWLDEKPGGEEEESIQLMYTIQPLKYMLLEPRSHESMELRPEGNFSVLYANFTFVRRLSGSLFNVYIPSTLCVFLSWIAFWVDIEAVPARVTLGVTSFLTLSTQIVQARTGLPSINYLTAMDVWLFACLITVFGALIEFAFAYQNFLHSKQVSTAPVDEPLQRQKILKSELMISRTNIGKHLVIRRLSPNRIQKVSPTKLTNMKNHKLLDKICRKVFPLVFSLFALIYWIYYMHLK